MSNNTTIADLGGTNDNPKHNSAADFPFALAIFFGGVLVGLLALLTTLCVLGYLKERRKRRQRALEQEAQIGSNATTDIPLQELNPASRTQTNTGGIQEVNLWAEGGDAEIQEPATRRRCAHTGVQGK
jgi:hypothetical protein